MDRLKRMETFVRIAKAGTMARAAEQLGISRAIVSLHLSQLEAHLGARLFNRTTRQLVLTEIGAEYFAFANRMLGELDEMEASVSHAQSQPRGPLRIACPLIFGHFLLSPLIAEFLCDNPGITATIILYDSRMTPVSMVDNAFDVVIQLGRVHDMSLASRTIGHIRYIACAAQGYVERHGMPLHPADLASHNCLIHRTRTPDSVWQMLSGGKLIKIKVAGTMLANGDSVLRAGVRKGLGIAVLPDYSIAGDLEQGRLIRVLPDYDMPSREITALLPGSRHLPRKLRAMLDFLSSRLGTI